jgi:hypothetical protein
VAIRAVAALLLAALCVSPALAQVKITPGPDKIQVEINGEPFTTFYIAGNHVTKPYLHPLRAATGTYVTRMWPMEEVAEEANTEKDHLHQRGLWFAHDAVNGLDFWNNEASYDTPNRGFIKLKKVGDVVSGQDSGSIAATFEWQTMDGKPLLTESRVMTFHADRNLRIVDFDLTLAAIGEVQFGDAKDGFFGVRVRPVLQEAGGTGTIVNADGLVSEKEAWGKPSRWCDYYGDIHGEKVGIAILDHPQNPNHPVRWHVRGYGLFAANPFGLSVFTNDKSQIGGITVPAGDSIRFRYRFVIHPGDAASADIDGMWNSYAAGN